MTAGKAQQTGAAWGRAWQRWLRQEKRLIAWGATQGVPAALTQTLLWVVKLILIGAMLYVAFWIVLLLVFIIVAATLVQHSDHSSESDGEWRHGQEGTGYYENGTRTDYGRLFDDDE